MGTDTPDARKSLGVIRGLGRWAATAVVIGSIIEQAVFLVASDMSREVGSGWQKSMPPKLLILEAPGGVEPPTCGLGNRRSIHLSYGATCPRPHYRTVLRRYGPQHVVRGINPDSKSSCVRAAVEIIDNRGRRSMPLVRISIPTAKSESYRVQISKQIYDAMREVLQIPEGDRFQVITEHNSGTLIADPGFMGMKRT